MNLLSVKNVIRSVVLGALLSACVDSPEEPLAATQQNPLAESFDMLSQEQMFANDIERSEEFRWAALALRAGVTPTVIEITNDGRPEVYDGFVHAVSWASLTQALRPPLHRSLIAWRRSGDILQVVLVGMAVDSAPVLNPFSMRYPSPGVSTAQSPVRGATAAYFERGARNSSWLGIGGMAKIAEHPAPSNCPAPNDDAAKPAGVSCQITRFGIELNVLYAATRSRDSREVDAYAPTRRLIAPAQTVAGVKLLFTCISPTSTGCN
jgi:hypothetical protein